MSDSRRGLTLIPSVVVALVGLVPQYLSRTIPDVAFPLWAAGRVLDGATLYVDILEINPPLFIWLDIPIVALARWTGLDPILVFRVAVTALLVASAWATYAVLTCRWMDGQAGRRIGGWTDGARLAALTFALFVLPRLDWGEREHLALALMLPWLALAVRRIEGREVSRWAALAIGIAAGVGIALKPHFVLVWVAREVVVWMGRRAGRRGDGPTGRRIIPADTWAPVIVCVAYLIAALVFTPEYFPMVRDLAGPYSRFIRATMLETMLGPAPAAALTSLVVCMGLRRPIVGVEEVGEGGAGSRDSRLVPAVTVLAATTAAWSVVALLQLKGFRYHWYPAMALGLLLLCHLARVARGVRISFTSRLFRAVATAAAVTTVVAASWGALWQAATPLSPEWDADPSIGPLLEALEGKVRPGDTLAVLSPNMASGFPLTNYLGTVWPLRLPAIWPAVTEYREALDAGRDVETRPRERMTGLEKWSTRITAEDLERARTEWLLLFRHFDAAEAGYMSRVRIREFVDREPSVARTWDAFDSLGTTGIYTIWHRGRAGEPPWAASPDRRKPVARGQASQPALVDGVLVWGALLLLVLAGDVVIAGRRR